MALAGAWSDRALSRCEGSEGSLVDCSVKVGRDCPGDLAGATCYSQETTTTIATTTTTRRTTTTTARRTTKSTTTNTTTAIGIHQHHCSQDHKFPQFHNFNNFAADKGTVGKYSKNQAWCQYQANDIQLNQNNVFNKTIYISTLENSCTSLHLELNIIQCFLFCQLVN